jgi:outer membrane biogenesis lipoprotein LolB
MNRALLSCFVLAVLAACGAPPPPPPKTAPDREVLQQVNGAVNEAIRNVTDCEAAKPLIKKAYEKIDWARPQLELPGSQPTLEALKVQLDRIAQACP